MDIESQNKWNNIYADATIGSYSISRILTENGHLLPKNGKALEIACGTGSDSIFLAQQGLQTDAWDISDTVVAKLNQHAQQSELSITAETRDINVQPPEDETYDVIVVAHFLERKMAPTLISALKPGGLLFYQTFVKEVTPSYSGPSNPAFRLDNNELLQLFPGMQIVVYREEGLVGDIAKGFRNEAMLVARKYDV